MIKIILLILLSFKLFANFNNQVPLPGYHLPLSKQGIADRNYNITSENRYNIFEKKLTIGIQKFNYYWKNAEDSTPSSNTLMSCKKGYILFPKNQSQKKLLNSKKYHCYKKRFIKRWHTTLSKNATHHIQASLVLWTTPKQYRDRGCEGFYFGLKKKHIMGGCYPKTKYYNDYEDWIKFTAYTFGKYVDHYIVWNEIDSTNWADSSSLKYSKNLMAKNLNFHKNRSFHIYTTLLKKTIMAVNNLDKTCLDYTGECKNLVYVSLTHDWYSRIPTVHINKNGDKHIRWRNMNLLDYIWSELGIHYNWSISVHPYGDAYGYSKNSLRFITLSDLSSYQKSKIDTLKSKNRSWLSYPQSRLFASEQNVGYKVKANNWRIKAKYICESYNIAVQMPELIAITHNHFQDNIHSKTAKPTKHTMLPSTVKADLSDAIRYQTFQAYQSTSINTWAKKDNHYCCKEYKLGCFSHP